MLNIFWECLAMIVFLIYSYIFINTLPNNLTFIFGLTPSWSQYSCNTFLSSIQLYWIYVCYDSAWVSSGCYLWMAAMPTMIPPAFWLFVRYCCWGLLHNWAGVHFFFLIHTLEELIHLPNPFLGHMSSPWFISNLISMNSFMAFPHKCYYCFAFLECIFFVLW